MDILHRLNGSSGDAIGSCEYTVSSASHHLSLTNPFHHIIPVSALAIDAEVGPGIVDMIDPVVGDDVQVGRTHYHLPEHLNAVVYHSYG